jgi:hypothetical protein
MKRLRSVFCFAALFFQMTSWAIGPDNWHLTNPSRVPYPLSAVCRGDNFFVAVGDQGTILTSSDGLVWTSRGSYPGAPLYSICFANGRYLATGLNTVLTSSNALNWSSTTVSNLPLFDRVVFGGGVYVGTAGFQGNVYSSTNGIDWTLRYAFGYELNDITYAFGRFVAVGIDTISSTNGIDWQYFPVPAINLNGVAYGNNVLTAVCVDTTTYTSTTGTNWVKHSPTTPNNYTKLTFGNGKFIGAGLLGITTSSDGITWSPTLVTTTPQSYTGLAAGGGRYVAVGNDSIILLSTNASRWDHYEPGSYVSSVAVAWGATNFVVRSGIGTPLMDLSSLDGGTWNATIGDYERSDIAFGAGLFVSVGVNTPLQISSDGIHWTNDFSMDFSSLEGVTYGNGQYVAAGAHTFTSTDARNWVQQSAPFLDSITFGKNLFVASSSGSIRTSPDAVTWVTQTNLPVSGQSPLLAFGNGRFVASISSGYLYSSSNGTNWIPCATNGAFYGVGFGKGTFVATTQSGDVFISRDGIHWQRRSTGVSLRLLRAAYGNNRFVLIGNNGVTLQSDPMPDLDIGPSLSGHGLELLVSGEGNPTGCFLQTSTNLVFWENAIATNIPGTLFLEIDPSTNAQRYYRLLFP